MNTQETERTPETEESAKNFQEQMANTGEEMYAKAEQAAAEAYEKTAKIASQSYDQAKSFGRENPEKVAIIAFGVGLGLGMLFCSRQSRTSRSTQAVVDALYDVAKAFLR